MNYIQKIHSHEFILAPRGNGIDSHRFWEALYLKTIPIVISNPLVNIIKKETNLPILILNDWSELNPEKLFYKDFIFNKDNEKYLSFEYYKNHITNY
jgi:hypothetical protein